PEDLDPNPHRPIDTIVNKYDRERNGYRACDVILPSVRFRERGPKLQAQTGESVARKAVITRALITTDGTQGKEDTSLAAIARASKKSPSKEVLTELKHSDPGFSAYAFNYCSKEECFDASIQIPVKAHRNEQFRIDYTGLFEFDVPVDDTVAVI